MVRLRAHIRASVIAISSTAVLFATPMAQPASADPLDDAKQKLAKVEQQQSEIGERWAQAKLQLTQSQAKVDRLNADIANQQRKVDALRSQAQQIALARYQARGVDVTIRLVTTPDPDGFLSDLSTMSKVDSDMNSRLQDFQAQQANLADLQRSARDQVSVNADEEKRLADLKGQIDAKIDEAQQVVNQLSAQERQRLAAEENGSRSADRPDDPVDVSGSADARALKAAAYAKGKVSNSRYVWGAEGPNQFDCSGLMLAAYRTVGISLPHSSRAQFGVGRPVSRDELKPGDLVFFYNPIHHVGMYIGNGYFAHARSPRNGLAITKLSSYPAYQGARRVIG